MKFVDAYILASTKRKTRRIRTALVIIVSSLLFAVLFALTLMGQGLLEAGKQVADVGFNSRNLTMIYPSGSDNFDYQAQTQRIQDAMDAELKARKIKVTEQTRQDGSYQAEFYRRLSILLAAQQTAQLAKVEAKVTQLGKPSALYHFGAIAIGQYALHQPDLAIDPLITKLQKEEESGGQKQTGGDPFSGEQLEFYTVEAGMFRTQVQPGQTLGWQPGQPYPLIVSYGYLEKLSNRSLAKLPATERNQGYRELIKTYTGKELTYCYRNNTAQDQLRAVMQYNKQVEADDNSRTTPLGLPVCAGFDQALLKKLDIISDSNPTGTKPLFPLPTTPAPVIQHVRFKIVGFVPAMQQFGSTDVITEMLSSIATLPTGPFPGFVPTEVVKADPLLQTTADTAGLGVLNLFVDFASRAEQKAFLEHGCSGSSCAEPNSLYVAPFGNIATALEAVFGFVSKALLIAAGVIMVIAALMIMFTISKVIADSTKEIAVFRSLGARRRDIAHIYYTYGAMLAVSALVVSLVLAVVAALSVSALLDQSVAQALIQATGAYNLELRVTLLGINTSWLLGISGALLVAAFVGVSIPILASLRRKLITILREE